MTEDQDLACEILEDISHTMARIDLLMSRLHRIRLLEKSKTSKLSNTVIKCLFDHAENMIKYLESRLKAVKSLS